MKGCKHFRVVVEYDYPKYFQRVGSSRGRLFSAKLLFCVRSSWTSGLLFLDVRLEFVIPVRPARSTRPATREEDERPGVEELWSPVESGGFHKSVSIAFNSPIMVLVSDLHSQK